MASILPPKSLIRAKNLSATSQFHISHVLSLSLQVSLFLILNLAWCLVTRARHP